MLVEVADSVTGKVIHVNPDKVIMIRPDKEVRGRMHVELEGDNEVQLSGQDLDTLIDACNRDIPTSGYVTISEGDAQAIRDMAKVSGLMPGTYTTMSTRSRQSKRRK